MNRIERLRNQLSYLHQAGVRRNLREGLIRESLSRSLGDPWPIRRAKAFKHILQNAEPLIFDDELIVGSILGIFPLREHQRSAEEAYAEARKHLFEIRRSGRPALASRALMEHDYDYLGSSIGYEELRSISQELARRDGAELGFSYSQIFGELQRYFSEDPQVWHLQQSFFHGPDDADPPVWSFANHLAVNYEKVLQVGYKGLLREAEQGFARASGSAKEFYHAVVVSVDAVVDFISRHADKASELAGVEANPGRRKELHEITALVHRISGEPAQSFREAVQLFWFTHLIIALGGGIALAAGRFDQYMYPFYKRDVESGRTKREEALELLTCLWFKFNEPKLGAVQNLTIGGITPGGKDGTNELSYLCLEAAAQARTPYPNMSARVHKATPDAFYGKVAEVIRLGMGLPAVFNDEIVILALRKAGFADGDAADYCVMGCQEIMIPKKQPSLETGMFFNLARHLLDVLGEPELEGRFPTFGDLLEAYKSRLCGQIEAVVARTNSKYERRFETAWDPFGSALLDDCLARGKDMHQGGTKYAGTVGMWGLGLATAADSLAAIRKLVYDEKAISLPELARALADSFENREALRQFLLNRLPKYGNDDDGVDGIAKEIAEFFCREMLRHRGTHGEFFLPLLASYMGHISEGEATGATPDGRRSAEPISDAASPAQGRDMKGPTAVLKSAAKIDYTLAPGGVALNLKFSARTLEGEKGLRNLISLLKAYFKQGGQEIQVNVVSRATLIDARAHPERYRNLIVRVAGFNEYFVKLDATLQNEIIARTEH